MILLYTCLLYSNLRDLSKASVLLSSFLGIRNWRLRNYSVFYVNEVTVRHNMLCPYDYFYFFLFSGRQNHLDGCRDAINRHRYQNLILVVPIIRGCGFGEKILIIVLPARRLIVTIINAVRLCFYSAFFLSECFAFSQRQWWCFING